MLGRKKENTDRGRNVGKFSFKLTPCPIKPPTKGQYGNTIKISGNQGPEANPPEGGKTGEG